MTDARTVEGQRFWDNLTERIDPNAPVEAFGTLTKQSGVVALRDELERAHVFRHLHLSPSAHVLDLGGGAGRFALRIAPRVARVTLVDLSPALLAIARSHAQARGLNNITFIQASAQEFSFPDRYELILIMGVATYLDSAQLSLLAERCEAALAPGGQLVLKEPVTTDGVPRDHVESNPGAPYHARFRPREEYARVFGRQLALRYQSPTLSHVIPWFLSGTEGAVQVSENAWGRRILARAQPLLVQIDPWLLALEQRMRARPLLARLLAPIPVLQDLYVFERPVNRRAPDTAKVDLSVVVIAFNEVLCIDAVVRELIRELDRARIDYELVLVDDGSSDGTLAAMRLLAQTVERVRVVALERNKGIGGALRAGFEAADGAFITWVPADGQIAPDSVLALYRRRREAPMLTTVYSARADAWFRAVISRSLNTLIKLRTGQVAKSGGNYLFSRSAWADYAPAADDSMMISTAFRHNLRRHGQAIVEVEISARARVAGSSKVLNPRTIVRTLDALRRIGRDGGGR